MKNTSDPLAYLEGHFCNLEGQVDWYYASELIKQHHVEAIKLFICLKNDSSAVTASYKAISFGVLTTVAQLHWIVSDLVWGQKVYNTSLQTETKCQPSVNTHHIIAWISSSVTSSTSSPWEWPLWQLFVLSILFGSMALNLLSLPWREKMLPSWWISDETALLPYYFGGISDTNQVPFRCHYSLDLDHWTGLLDWITGLTSYLQNSTNKPQLRVMVDISTWV